MHLWSGVQEGDVNLADPASFALHKIIGFGEQSTAKRADAAQDLAQATSLIARHPTKVEGGAFRMLGRLC